MIWTTVPTRANRFETRKDVLEKPSVESSRANIERSDLNNTDEPDTCNPEKCESKKQVFADDTVTEKIRGVKELVRNPNSLWYRVEESKKTENFDSNQIFQKSYWIPIKRPPSKYERARDFVSALEPWGVLIGIIGFGLALIAFGIDLKDKHEDRINSAWELLSIDGPGNSGKIAALEFLNRRKSIFGITVDEREPLTGIDLSKRQNEIGTYLEQIDLDNAILRNANLSRANLARAKLRDVDFYCSVLIGANLFNAKLTGSNFENANLSGADLQLSELGNVRFIGANLVNAKLTGAYLHGTYLFGANLSGADLEGVHYLDQLQLDEACGDEKTKLPDSMTIDNCENLRQIINCSDSGN